MYQISEFQTRNFADTINPCTNEASGPGRQNAAEWLRVGFHDMSTADKEAGTGGLDASIQYELDTGENLGPGFNTTLAFMSNFLTARSSMADLIALGVYASVRSCGGPAVPFRAGRIDAVGPGRTGVPQPDHPIESFRKQFARMGFTPAEMIQVTACGHTIGGVHEAEFPELLIQGEAPLDSSVADFDNRVVTEYLAGNSTNPLVAGPAVALGKASDARIFASDGNATARALADATVFQDVCQAVLQKMIDVVPRGVVLTDPVRPYRVKPLNMQLGLNPYARDMRLTGRIRVRSTDLPKEMLGELTLTYKDRNGTSDCGPCTTRSTFRGVSYGFDDSFVVSRSFPSLAGSCEREPPPLTVAYLVLSHRRQHQRLDRHLVLHHLYLPQERDDALLRQQRQPLPAARRSDDPGASQLSQPAHGRDQRRGSRSYPLPLPLPFPHQPPHHQGG